jgi:uncharacterized protein with GYD domain
MAKFAYTVARVGAVTTETLPAFSEAEHKEVLASLDKAR